MKILVDHQIFLNQTAGGVSRYHATINNYINKSNSQIKSNIIALGHKNIYIPRQGGALTYLNVRGARRVLRSINKWKINSSLNEYDIIHPSFYEGYFLKNPKRPKLVITMHDMIPEVYFKSRAQWMIDLKKEIIPHADGIIAISETTKKELLGAYPIDEEKIHVVYHGYPEDFHAVKEKDNFSSFFPDNFPNSYLLFIGTRIDYKNFTAWLSALAKYLKTNHLGVVVAGDPPTDAELTLVNELGLAGHIFFTGRITDSLLNALYRNALCFVFPSSFEGFGMPLLEAFASKCPVACSNIEVFHEICQNAAIYFDPHDQQSMVQAVDRFCTSESTRSEYIEAGSLRLKNFSWQDATDKTMAVYASIK